MSTIIVRRQPRSKGCEQCVARRVKCDERAGCCKKCARFGLPCSGAIRGAVFLDMTEKVSRNISRPRKKKKRTETKEKRHEEEQRDGPSNADDVAKQQSSAEESDSLANLPTPSTFITGYETEFLDLSLLETESVGETNYFSMAYPSDTLPVPDFDNDEFSDLDFFDSDISIPPSLDAPAYNEYCFVGNFAQLIISSRQNYSSLRPQSWILELPHLLATDSLPPPLKYATHAAALSYHAVTNHDTNAEVAAIKWYLAGIKSYRAMVLGSQTNKTLTASVPEETSESGTPFISDTVEVCVPVMFSFYESLRGTSTEAELLHHEAATRMLETRGPEKCVSGLAHGVMRSLRVREAFHSVMQNRAATLSSPEWLSVPFQQKHKICYDRLIDILLSFTKVLRLPSMNQGGATLRSSIHRIHDLSTARKAGIEEKATALLAQLEDWWLEFREEHCEIMALSSGCSSAPEVACVAVASPSSVLPLSGPWMVANSETLAASTISIYSAIHIILHTILLIISLSRPPHLDDPDGPSAVHTHQAAISAYSASVLNASLYLSMINPFCGDTVRTAFSMSIVSQFALEDSQRDEAQRMLRQWKIWNKGPPDKTRT